MVQVVRVHTVLHTNSNPGLSPTNTCVYKYQDPTSLAAVLATNKLAGVTQEVNLRNTLAKQGSTQMRDPPWLWNLDRCHEKSKIRAQTIIYFKNFKKRNIFERFILFSCEDACTFIFVMLKQLHENDRDRRIGRWAVKRSQCFPVFVVVKKHITSSYSTLMWVMSMNSTWELKKNFNFFFIPHETSYSDTIVVSKYDSESNVEQSSIYKRRNVTLKIVHKPLGK